MSFCVSGHGLGLFLFNSVSICVSGARLGSFSVGKPLILLFFSSLRGQFAYLGSVGALFLSWRWIGLGLFFSGLGSVWVALGSLWDLSAPRERPYLTREGRGLRQC